MGELVTIEDAAEILNRKARTIRHWCQQGLPSIKIGRKRYVDIDQARQALRTHAQADRSKAIEHAQPTRVRKHLTGKYNGES